MERGQIKASRNMTEMKSKFNIYNFKRCIRCNAKKEEEGYTLSYLELQEIGCNKGKPFATLPVCDDCYYELFEKRNKKRKWSSQGVCRPFLYPY